MRREEALYRQRVAYHLRAPEWDTWITGYMEPVRPELIARVGDGTFDGKVVGEYAAGTGYFTQLIAARAQRVVASDASPAMLQQLRRKHLANVATAMVDVLDAWCPVPDQYEVIFFGHWLSHIPDSLLPAFLAGCEQALRPGGQLAFLDMDAREIPWLGQPVWQEEVGAEQVPLSVRPTSDGTDHVVVKYFRNARELLAAMGEWGWAGTSVPIGAANGRGFYWCTASRKT
jgi:2-polyprenyl-3-methyl-5-hydroxy-6-metoxy-1,4-benzoquinol methylase